MGEVENGCRDWLEKIQTVSEKGREETIIIGKKS